MTPPSALLSCVTIALSLAAIGQNLASRRSAPEIISLTTPEEALVSHAVACYGRDVRNLLKGGRANNAREAWPAISNPKTLAVAKVSPVEDSKTPENNGLVMCFISYKTAGGVTKREVVFLRKNFQGDYASSPFDGETFATNEADERRRAAIRSWESDGKLD